jgi:SPP1 family phage portal protein
METLHKIFEGRRKILTSCLPINMQPAGFEGTTLDETTLPDELNRALSIHEGNRRDIQRLRGIYLGEQNIYLREKDGVDRFVNNMVCVNYANAFTRQIVGYTYPVGIQFVPIEEKVRPGVEKINRFMKSENKNMLDKVMETEQSIFGTHYRAILPDTVMPDECPFEILPLNADNTFVVYSIYDPNMPVYGCSMHPTKQDMAGFDSGKWVYKIYTNNLCYTYISESSGGIHPTDLQGPPVPHILRHVPIIEYPNNEFRLGDWEMAIDLFDAINTMSSDCLNNVVETVLSYLVLLGVETPTEDELKLMRKYRTLTFKGIPQTNQDAKFITAQLDGQSTDLLRTYFENALRVVVGIPDRNSSGGGDTGEAINAKNGWREIDTVANNKAMFTEASEREMLRITLQILSPKYVSEDLSVLDIDISIPRNKNDNLQTKTQAGSEMYQMHMPKVDIVRTMDITTDNEGLVKRWEESEKEALTQQKAPAPSPASESSQNSDPNNQKNNNNPQKADPPLDKAANG